MYNEGKGVAPDHALAVEWWRCRTYAQAQFALDVACWSDLGVAKDNIATHI